MPGLECSTSTLGFSVGLLAFTVVAAYIVYLRCFHPLADHPGPFWASLTNLWSFHLSLKGNWPHRLDELHLQYGPIVRIAPNEVAINDKRAIADIYGLGKGFARTAFYKPFGNPAQHDNLFNATSDVYHAQLRRWGGNAFAMKTVLEFEDGIQNMVQRLVHNLKPVAESGTVCDMAMKFRSFAFDVSAMLSCGAGFGCIEQGDVTGLMRAFQIGNSGAAHVGRFPMLYPIFAKIRAPAALVKGFAFVDEFLEAQMAKHEAEIENVAASDQMAILIRSAREKSDTPFTLLAPARERTKQLCQSIIAAGFDTTGSTLTALLFYLSTNIQARDKLVAEILSQARLCDCGGRFSPTTVNEMPYLNACIKEALRLHPTVAYHLPRIVPKGGAQIAGKFFPGGSQVGVNAWQIHQDEAVFGPECRAYHPERWLDRPHADLLEMERCMFAFGAGSRTCIGKNISLLELRLLIPSLLWHYEFELLGPSEALIHKSQWFAVPEATEFRLAKRVVKEW